MSALTLRTKFRSVTCLPGFSRSLVQLAGRKFLPGSHGTNFPEFLQPQRNEFPLLVTAQSVGVVDSMTPTRCAQAVAGKFQRDLHKYGAVLYRGFPITNCSDFSQFFSALGNYRSMPYIGGAAPRKQVGDKVFTASDEPPEVCIDLHNEMAYMHTWPKLVFFTEERKDVKDYLEGIGADYEWENDGSLTFGYTRPASVQYPVTGETLWFNHAHRKHASIWKYNHPLWSKYKDLPYNRFPTHSYYGDGSEIPENVIQHIRDVMWSVAVGFQMQKSDVMVLENNLVQHARLSFTGERKLLVAILEDQVD